MFSWSNGELHLKKDKKLQVRQGRTEYSVQYYKILRTLILYMLCVY